MSARSISTSKESLEGNMSDDDQDFLDSLEKEATEYNKVCPPSARYTSILRLTRDTGCRDRPHSQGIQPRFVSPIFHKLCNRPPSFYILYGY